MLKSHLRLYLRARGSQSPRPFSPSQNVPKGRRLSPKYQNVQNEATPSRAPQRTRAHHQTSNSPKQSQKPPSHLKNTPLQFQSRRKPSSHHPPLPAPTTIISTPHSVMRRSAYIRYR